MKRWATAYVGTTYLSELRKYIANGFTFYDSDGNAYWRYYETCLLSDRDEITLAINNYREDKRVEARKRLLDEKERIL
jgi:hypothetical protein